MMALTAMILPFSAHAQVDTGDTALVLASTALILIMTIPGLALFYAGFVQAKNVISVMMQNFALTCIISILWVVVGYSLAFSGDSTWSGDLGRLFMANISADSAINGTIPENVFAAFQMTFAIITLVVITGTYAERMNFAAVLIFSVFWHLAVYVPVAHWVWGSGIMATWGVMDFAGGLVVHTTAGVAALVIALVLGPRMNFPHSVLPPHNPVLTAYGACLIWVGWLGFNGGSALSASQSAGMALLVTHIAAVIGALSWVVIEWIRFARPTLIGAVTGMVAGLAAVTPAAGFVGIPGGMILGIAGGLACYYIVMIRVKLELDDCLDVFAVHGAGGIIGSLLVAFMATEAFSGRGLPEGVTATSQFIIQLKSVFIVAAWTAVATYASLKLTALIVPLRVSKDVEIDGLDISQHGETGYHDR
jgi:Amt family ammonium transporter